MSGIRVISLNVNLGNYKNKTIQNKNNLNVDTSESLKSGRNKCLTPKIKYGGRSRLLDLDFNIPTRLLS